MEGGRKRSDQINDTLCLRVWNNKAVAMLNISDETEGRMAEGKTSRIFVFQAGN